MHGSVAFGWSCLAESVVVAGPIHQSSPRENQTMVISLDSRENLERIV